MQHDIRIPKECACEDVCMWLSTWIWCQMVSVRSKTKKQSQGEWISKSDGVYFCVMLRQRLWNCVHEARESQRKVGEKAEKKREEGDKRAREREKAVLFLRGSHPDSVSGGPGEGWREARAEHETDRKQIGPEPAAINHQCGARPLHSSHMHRTHTNTHISSRKWIVATQVKSPAAAPMGIKGRKITLLTSFSSALFLRSLPVSEPPCLLELRLPWITRGQRTDTHKHTRSGMKAVCDQDVCERKN